MSNPDKKMTIKSLWFIAFQLLTTAGFPQEKDLLHQLPGSWLGTLKVQGIELRLVMNIAFNPADSAIVTFDSPDQGASDIPTSKVVVKGDSLFVSLKMVGGKLTGKVSPDRLSISGVWKQGGFSLPITMNKQEKKLVINRPQEPKPPYPYTTAEVTFRNEKAGIVLAGTLTIPKGEGRFPAVILVSGSGPQNRDEETLGHKPFLVLADHLTRQGIMVLRYDDRGVARSGGSFVTATTIDFASDAEAAIGFLMTRPEADTTRIGLLGHSEGGLIAPMVASARKDVAFIVLYAGPGMTGEQVLLTQARVIGEKSGTKPADLESEQKLLAKVYSILKKTPDNTKAGEMITRAVRAEDKKHHNDTSYKTSTDAELALQLQSVTSPWMRCFLTLDPAKYLQQVKCPVMAVNGSLDLQVIPEANLRAIESALLVGGNPHYTVKEFPGLNHLFQHATTGLPSEYSKIEETVSPEVLGATSDWILETIRR
jgi:pimeloyl-ACP methyl ester carboxylesterase